MPSTLPAALRSLNPDGRLLSATRGPRLFAHGFLAVVLVLNLHHDLPTSDARVGLHLTLILPGDTVLSLAVTALADRLGRLRLLIPGAVPSGFPSGRNIVDL